MKALVARPDGGIEYPRRIGVGAFCRRLCRKRPAGKWQMANGKKPNGVNHGHESHQTTGDLDPARRQAGGLLLLLLLRHSGPKAPGTKASLHIPAACKFLGGGSPEGHTPEMLGQSARASLARAIVRAALPPPGPLAAAEKL